MASFSTGCASVSSLRSPCSAQYIFADQQLVQFLQIGQSFQKQNAYDQLVGVLHLVDRFLMRMFAELVEPQFLNILLCKSNS